MQKTDEIPSVIAHRGASHEAPENTLPAYLLAEKQGAEGWECDIHRTRDGQLVVIHDTNTKRTAGVDMEVTEHTYDELRNLDVGKWKDPKYSGTRIPLLKELVEILPENRKLLIEVKGDDTRVVPPLLKTIQQSGKKPEQFSVISFALPILKAIKQKSPKTETMWLPGVNFGIFTVGEPVRKFYTRSKVVRLAKEAGMDGIDVDAGTRGIPEKLIKKAQAAGLKVAAWTVDSPEKAERLAELGVGVTTNRPAHIREAVEKGREKAGRTYQKKRSRVPSREQHLAHSHPTSREKGATTR